MSLGNDVAYNCPSNSAYSSCFGSGLTRLSAGNIYIPHRGSWIQCRDEEVKSTGASFPGDIKMPFIYCPRKLLGSYVGANSKVK
jgi:hypothetical protein